MPPRLSLRRLFLYIIGCGSLVIVFTNVRQGWSRWTAAPWQHGSASDSAAFSGDGLEAAVLAGNGLTTTTTNHAHKMHNKQKSHDAQDGHRAEELFEIDNEIPKEKLWFMTGGTIRPSPADISSSGLRTVKLFPSENPTSDRITEQLMYLPSDYSEDVALKKILVYNGLATWSPAIAGQTVFLNSKCPVNRCLLTANRDEAKDADAILYKDQFLLPPINRPSYQIWILYFLECPYHTGHMKFQEVFNWTATYRHDSDIVAPYERWTYYNPRIQQLPQERNYAVNKTRKVAWFVSNCGARNERLAYARELQKYIQVDIYGSCGPLKCARSNTKHCFELLNNDYKFYLAFENSNCKDYITEKFYVNGLGQNVLPIVMGAKPEDYERSAPYRSYIHVDEFASPKELAGYLHRLDKNDDLYNSYFRWKGTGEFINTYFWCRLCAMLHDPVTSFRYYEDVNEWWRGNGICNSGSWRKKKH